MKRLATLSAMVALTMQTSYANAVDLIGHATAQEFQNVVAQISGVVETPPHQIGEKVLHGQSLIEIEADDFKLEVRRQKANLELAKADLKIKQSIYTRYKELRNKKSLSQHELDIAYADLQASKANVQLAEIELEKAQNDLAHTHVIAELNGYIVNKNVDQGSWVDKGNLLYSVASVDNIIIRFLASEHDLSELKVGQEITIWSDSKPSDKVKSTIKRIGINLDAELLAYPVDVEIPNSDGFIKPGMSLHATTSINN